MRIGAKILIPNLVSLGLMAFVLLYLVAQLREERPLLERQMRTIADANRLAAGLERLDHDVAVHLLSYRYDPTPARLAMLRQSESRIAGLLDELPQVIVSVKGRALLAKFMESRAVSRAAQEALIDAIGEGNEDQIARSFMRWSFGSRLSGARLDDLLTHKSLTLDAILADIGRRREWIGLVVAVLTAFALGSIVASSLYYGRTLARPILSLTDVAQRIAHGDVNSRIELPARNDEIDELAHAFNRMADELVLANEQLEHKVAERTGELAKANVSLRREMAERQKAETALLQSERLAAVGQMITGLSHESRNALQRSLACLEMLGRRLQDDSRLRFLVEEARKAQEELQQVYEGVRNYAGPIVLERTPRDLRIIWRAAWEQTAPLRDNREAELSEPVDGADLTCSVDAYRMGQVFRNLMENALAACPDPVLIQVTAEDALLDERPAVRVIVQDNGPGLDEEQRRRLFEPFFTTKTKGTGLGMSIVKRIVEAHGGKVGILERTSQGLAVEFILPRAGDAR